MKISEQEFRALLDRYLSNTASAEERELLDRFFSSYDQDLSDATLVPEDPRFKEALLQSIHARTGFDGRARNSLRKVWMPAAAAISLIILAYVFLMKDIPVPGRSTAPELVVLKTNAGQKLLTTLPDGSRVHLNGDSKISYPRTFDQNARKISLDGEGYFEVVKSTKPFVVHTGQIRTEVLGTSFNVKSSTDEAVSITLVAGKVNVISQGEQSLLEPHHQAVVTVASGAIRTREVDIERYISWKDNILYFQETSLREAVEMLESWYAVKIDVVDAALEKCTITAKYRDEPLGNVLSSFQFLLNLKITRTRENHYSIDGDGCK